MKELILIESDKLESLENKIDGLNEALQRGLHSDPGESSRWLDTEGAIAYTGFSRPSLQRYRNAGRIPFVKVGKGPILYRGPKVLGGEPNHRRLHVGCSRDHRA